MGFVLRSSFNMLDVYLPIYVYYDIPWYDIVTYSYTASHINIKKINDRYINTVIYT